MFKRIEPGALAFALVAAFPRAIASNPSQNPLPKASSWGVDLIPTLILVVTVILSLEIADHPRVARPLSAALLVALWTTILNEHLQMASLLAATVYHIVPELYREWTRGFPCIFQLGMADHKLQLWLRFWLRVFVWSTTLATANALPLSTMIPLFIAVYCASTETLLRMYFTSEQPQPTMIGCCTSLLLGVLWQLRLLPSWATAVALGVMRPVVAVAALVVLMVVSVLVEGPRIVASFERLKTSLQRFKTSLVAFVTREVIKTTTTTKTRKSFLYRSGSDVEVVGMAIHYHAYDLRHAHDDPTHA